MKFRLLLHRKPMTQAHKRPTLCTNHDAGDKALLELCAWAPMQGQVLCLLLYSLTSCPSLQTSCRWHYIYGWGKPSSRLLMGTQLGYNRARPAFCIFFFNHCCTSPPPGLVWGVGVPCQWGVQGSRDQPSWSPAWLLGAESDHGGWVNYWKAVNAKISTSSWTSRRKFLEQSLVTR